MPRDGRPQNLAVTHTFPQLPGGQGSKDAPPPTLRPALCPVPLSMAMGDRAAWGLMSWVLESDRTIIKSLLANCVTQQVLKLTKSPFPRL